MSCCSKKPDFPANTKESCLICFRWTQEKKNHFQSLKIVFDKDKFGVRPGY